MARTLTAATDNVDWGSPTALDDLSTLTICGWVYRTADAGNQILYRKGWTPASAGMLLIIENGGGEGAIRFLRGSATTFSDYQSAVARVPLNTWTFIAVAASAFATASGVDLFYGSLSAVAVEEASYTTTADGAGSYGSDAAGNAIVGGDGTDYFRGRVAQWRVFNRKLTISEIQREQYSPVAATSGCVLDTEFHAAIVDRSPTAAAATITGTTVSDHPPLWGRRRSPRRAVSVSASTQDIAVTNTALYFSPYNTRSDGAGSLGSNNIKGSSTYARWTTPGAYLDFKVTVASGGAGNVSLLLDTTSLNGLTANRCPILAYGYDDRPQTTNQPAYSTSPVVLALATGLAAGTYTFYVEFKAVGLNSPGDRFTPANAVRISGVRIDATASVSAATRPANGNWIVFGDSIGEGAGTIAAADPAGDVEATDNDATQAFPFLFRKMLGVDVGMICYGGSGYTKGINNVTASSTNPSLWSSTAANRFADQIEAGVSRLISSAYAPVPTGILIITGGNDASLSAAEVTAAINGIRTAAGSSCWIFVAPDPLPNMATAAISAGVAAATQTTRTIYILPTPLHDNTSGNPNRYSSDGDIGGAHLNVRGQAIVAGELVRLMTDHIESSGAGGYSVARVVNAA